MMYLLDTDIATLIQYGRNERVRLRYDSIQLSHAISIPIVTRIQILRGRIDSILKASTQNEMLVAMERFEKTEKWLSGFKVVPVTANGAYVFEELHKGKKGKKIGIPDTLIAAIALDSDATLVTRNVKDFATIPGLRLENWAA